MIHRPFKFSICRSVKELLRRFAWCVNDKIQCGKATLGTRARCKIEIANNVVDEKRVIKGLLMSLYIGSF